MATSKIKNPHVPGSVLAESTGNKTYANHFKALYSAYAALNQAKKQICAIVIGDDIYRTQITSTPYGFVKVMGNISTTELNIEVIRIQSEDANFTRWKLTTSGITRTSLGTESYNGTVQLVYGI